MLMDQVMTLEDVQDFKNFFHTIINDVVSDPECPDMPQTNQRLIKILNYNVPHGKLNRGIATVMAYKVFAQETSKENDTLAFVLGWCVELTQAFAVVLDDIMDHSVTRRGRKCWHTLPEVGMLAINDGIILEQFCYYLVRKHFRHKNIYPKLLEMFHDLIRKTAYGQELDGIMENEKSFEDFTPETYKSIVTYKTSYYTFCLPVFIGMILAEVDDEKLWKDLERILLEIGHYFQVQDDFLDCFGSESVTGKIGTDIEDGKCTWLLVQALQIATNEQKQILSENVGKPGAENVQVVKDLYRQMNLEGLYRTFETEQFKFLANEIEQVQSTSQVKLLLITLLRQIHRRSS